MIDIAADYLRFDGEFIKSVSERVNFDESLVMFFLETIEKIRLFELAPGLPSDDKKLRRACSGIFSLYLTLIRYQPAKFDVGACTTAMNDFFKQADVVRDFSLVNVGSNSSAKPIFDFRNLRLVNCHFERFDFFWECLMDENTRFEECTFRLLEPRKDINPEFYSKTFSSTCNTSGIAHILEKKKRSTEQRSHEVQADLIKFFKLFLARGNFYPQKQEYIKGKVFTGTYLPTLLKERVIEEYIDPKKPNMSQYRVALNYFSIIKYVEQATPSIEFDKVLQLFSR
jgi:hypothetical protein